MLTGLRAVVMLDYAVLLPRSLAELGGALHVAAPSVGVCPDTGLSRAE